MKNWLQKISNIGGSLNDGEIARQVMLYLKNPSLIDRVVTQLNQLGGPDVCCEVIQSYRTPATEGRVDSLKLRLGCPPVQITPNNEQINQVDETQEDIGEIE